MLINELKNKHICHDVVILTCGNSLTEYPKNKVISFLKDKIVICIKESIIEYKEYANYFIANGTRERNFDILENTIKIYQGSTTTTNINYDLFIEEDMPFTFELQLLNIKNFEKYDFDNFEKRPWGPGILYETVFYLCKYMGCKNVYTIGWDLIDIKKDLVISHYFDAYENNEYKTSERWKLDNNPKNKYVREMTMVNENITYMYDFFKKKGMNIFVVGNKSYVNKNIPRIYL